MGSYVSDTIQNGVVEACILLSFAQAVLVGLNVAEVERIGRAQTAIYKFITRLQQEVRAAIEIQCVDCHGTTVARATLLTTGPASYTSGPKGRNLSALRTPSGKPPESWSSIPRARVGA